MTFLYYISKKLNYLIVFSYTSRKYLSVSIEFDRQNQHRQLYLLFNSNILMIRLLTLRFAVSHWSLKFFFGCYLVWTGCLRVVTGSDQQTLMHALLSECQNN